MPQITNEQVFNSLNTINELLNKELPALASYRVRKLYTELANAWNDVMVVKDLLLKRHAELGDNDEIVTTPSTQGDIATFKEGERALFDEGWNSILQDTVTIQTQLSVASFGDVKVTPALLIKLGELLQD